MSFLVQLSSTIGRRLDSGPGGFLGFGNAINVPLPSYSRKMCCSNNKLKLMILAIGADITFVAHGWYLDQRQVHCAGIEEPSLLLWLL